MQACDGVIERVQHIRKCCRDFEDCRKEIHDGDGTCQLSTPRTNNAAQLGVLILENGGVLFEIYRLYSLELSIGTCCECKKRISTTTEFLSSRPGGQMHEHARRLC